MAIKKYALISMAIVLTSCEFQCSVGGNNKNKKDDTTTYTSTEPGTLNGAVIKNGIELEATDVKVKKAYLTNDAGILLDSNMTKLNENIVCMVELDTGWTKMNDKSYVGATERITADDGTVLLDGTDMFKNLDSTGIPADKAKYIWLNAVVTQKHPGMQSYSVQFRIWDKKGKGVITGKYKFKVQ